MKWCWNWTPESRPEFRLEISLLSSWRLTLFYFRYRPAAHRKKINVTRRFIIDGPSVWKHICLDALCPEKAEHANH